MRTILLLILISIPASAAEPITWLTDYTTGRKEASEAGKAVCLVIGGEHCIYCRKLEAVTLADPAIIAKLNKDYVAIKLDGNRETELAKALKVTLYPTTVLAGADGTIHAIINGYVDAAQMKTHLDKTLVAIADARKAAKVETSVVKDVPAATPGASVLELEKLKIASREADEKAAALQLQLAEALQQHGDAVGATKCYETVMRLCPNSTKAEIALVQLSKMKTPLQAVPASMKK